MKQFTAKDITAFLAQYIEIGDVYTVDEQALVFAKADNSPAMLKNAAGVPAQLSVYSTNQTVRDTLVINPFAEGVVSSAEINWFYGGRSQLLGFIIARVMNGMITRALPKSDPLAYKEELPTVQLKFISPFAERVDSKMLVELKKIHEPIINFFNLYHSAKEGTVTARCGLFESTFRDSFAKQVRQKTWVIFQEMMEAILGTKDPRKDLVSKCNQAGYGRLKAYSDTYLKILQRLEPIWELSGLSKPDLDSFAAHVEMIPLYHTRAKHMIAPSVVETSAADTKISPPWFGTPGQVLAGGGAPVGQAVAQQVPPPVAAAPPIYAKPGTPPPMTQAQQPYGMAVMAPPVAPVNRYATPGAPPPLQLAPPHNPYVQGPVAAGYQPVTQVACDPYGRPLQPHPTPHYGTPGQMPQPNVTYAPTGIPVTSDPTQTNPLRAKL